jgi:hypothetical protein
MWFRRAILLAAFPAAVILPLWVIVTQGIVAAPSAGQYLGLLVVCPILFVVMIVTAVLLRARKSVRDARAFTWRDAALLAAGWLALIASGIFPLTALVVADVVLVIGAFWLALWELVDESRKRLRTFVDGFTMTPTASPYIPPARGETIIIEPHRP